MIQNLKCDCGKKYKINDDKIKGKKAKVKCSACGNTIVIFKQEVEEIYDSDFIYDQDEPDVSANQGPALIGRAAPVVRPFLNNTNRKEKENNSMSDNDKSYAKYAAGNVSWKNSIQTRISAILIIITTIILAGFAVFNYDVTKSKMDKELNLFSEITTTRMSNYLIEPMWDLDEKQVESSIISEMMEKQIYAIIIRDHNNAVFQGKKRDGLWEIIKSDGNISGNYIVKHKDIARGDEKIGSIEIYITSGFMQEDFKQSIINIAVTAVILNICIFFAIIIALRKIIIRPIIKLTDVAGAMSLGDLKVKIDIHSRNEIGTLAEAIERMQFSLRLAIERLRQR